MAAGGLIRVWKRPFRAPAGPIAPLRGARGPSARPFPSVCPRPLCRPLPLRASAGPIAPLRGARGTPARPFSLRLSAPAVQAPLAPCARRPHCTPAGSARPTRPGPFPPFVRGRRAGPSRSVRDMYSLVNSHLDFAQILRIFAFAKEGNRRGGCPLAFYKAGSGGIWRRDGQN